MNGLPGRGGRRRPPVGLPVLLLAMLLGGCAEQLIRRESQEAMGQGDYQRAVRTLEDGLARYPSSIPLRSSLLQMRTEALTQTLSRVATLRAQGRLDDAEAELLRLKALDPGNGRVDALLAELQTARRQNSALDEALALAAKDQADAALLRIAAALKDDPRHAGLVALQRKLEAQQRLARAGGFDIALAETRPITLDFRDAGLRMVLDVVSRSSGVNFIMDRDVRAETRVTVFLRQARVEDALDLIISTGQLAKKVVDPQTIVIYPDTPEKRRQYQEQVVRVFHLGSAEAKGAAAFLRAMLGLREPFVDERSNMLALRDTPENIRLAERLIAMYDTSDPEVLLEVEVLEVSASRLTELGIKFPDTFSLTALVPAGASGLTLGNVQGLNSDRIGLGVAGLLVNLRREVGDFTTLANPRIRVRNKAQAKILVGDKIPVITTTTGNAGFVSDTVTYLDVGLKLDVEPSVFADDEVAIKVALEVSTLGAAVRTGSGTLAYQIGTRNASTLLRLRDGETQLLAGLISRDDRTSSSRVPGVGDLPVLGRLFSSQQDSGNSKELVLAITPRILRNNRRLEASEAELWVGTEAQPRLRRPPLAAAPAPAPAPAAAPAAALPTTPPPMGQAPGLLPAPPAAPTPGQGPGLAPGQGAGQTGGAGAAGPMPGRTGESLPGATQGLGAAAPGPTSVRWVGPQELSAGQVFELTLHLQSGLPLRGLPMDVAFDPQRLQLLGAKEGDYFNRDAAPTSFTHSLDAAAGRLRAGVLRNQATAAAGDGAVLVLSFKALAPGPASVSLARVQPIHLTAEAPRVLPGATWSVQVR